MIYHSKERNCLACLCKMAAVQRRIENMVRIRNRIRVSSVNHNAVLFIHSFKSPLNELLCVLAVIRIRGVKVRIYIRAQRRYRNSDQRISYNIRVILVKTCKHFYKRSRRNTVKRSIHSSLNHRRILKLQGITAVNRFNSVLLIRETI